MFRAIRVNNWRQFAEVAIDFHPRLTVLTGANGAGKTTLLHLLNRHWGWNIQYVSSPRSGRKGHRRYWAGFWNPEEAGSEEPDTTTYEIGTIEYAEHPSARLTVPRDVDQTFQVKISPMPGLSGVYVPSHRPLYLHHPVENIPTKVDARKQIFDLYMAEVRNQWAVNRRVKSPSFMLKQSLISLATFSYETEAIAANPEAREAFEGFQEILAVVLPATLGFKQLRVKVPDVILETSTGDFSLDAVSGGVSALIDVAWQVFLYSSLFDEFVVVIDEPEAHLHPALQQSVLPNLLEAFPTAQFIVASHNPFVVTSAQDSAVYVLRYDQQEKVNSFLLGEVNKAGSANEILRDVLGVQSTSAQWVDDELKRVLAAFADADLTEESLERLRQDLNRLGLGRFLPQALDQLESGSASAQ